MNIEEDILIQNFLNGKLSEQERNEVLSKIEENPDFKEKVNFEKQLHLNLNHTDWSIGSNHSLPEVKEYEELLKDATTQELKNTLKTVNSDYQKKQIKQPRSWLLYSGIAAILLLIGVTIFSTSNNLSSEELYASYINHSELPSLIDRGSTDQTVLINAQKLFEAKQYDQALDILTNDIDSVQQNKAIVYLYTGISQMELNQFDQAENTFNKLINSKFIDAPKGIWFKALLLLKQNKIKDAKDLLMQIAKSPSNYKSKEASELLEQL
ncbi:tetratricopeptide repeat protein [Aquimarina sp. 2201CG14-23]|uniref:tetratricopeptide repeat protein n=1 Tax=Aquimarina mycalae TaxID=3040073 RepID=UPI002477EC41|nr:tetratricopeptide repeat protein [Aquimarina sp. 2201CG14-23]MDH7445725.1 hypothetical protein [Aquimarina sp. 2201CG14-23]